MIQNGPKFTDLDKIMQRSLALGPKLLSHTYQEVNAIFDSSQYEYLLAYEVMVNNMELKRIQTSPVTHPLSSVILGSGDS